MIDSFFQHALDSYFAPVRLLNFHNVGGGCINHAAKLITTRGAYFIKYNSELKSNLFVSEANGLSLLKKNSSIRTPEVVGYGNHEGIFFLLMEWIDSGQLEPHFWGSFGKNLATLHKVSSDNFGLDHNNFLGSLPQSNQMHRSWHDFFIKERLEPQLRMASDGRLIDQKFISRFNLLFSKLESLIPDEPPALIHGDLWSGNFLTDIHSKPALIDPAVHFGHRETELSFTHLFGGFDKAFYEAYQYENPLQPGFNERIAIHNLYPLLVHVNLFSSSYLSGVEQALKKFM